MLNSAFPFIVKLKMEKAGVISDEQKSPILAYLNQRFHVCVLQV